MNGKLILFAAAAFAFLVASCTGFQKSVIEDIYIRDDARPAGGRFVLALGDISVRAELSEQNTAENVRSIAGILIAKRNQAQGAGDATVATEKRYTTAIVVHEEAFLKDFESVNAVTCELRLYTDDPSKGPAVIAIISEETKETIASYGYLYTLLDRSFGKVIASFR